MVKPSNPNESNRENSGPASTRKTQRVLNTRFFVSTFLIFAVVGAAAYFVRAYQVRRAAFALKDRAEALAKGEETLAGEKEELAGEKKEHAEEKKEKNPGAAASYYGRYLELYPEDASARLRRAELYEQAYGSGSNGIRTIELYQEALRPAKQGLAPEKQLEARRHLTDLLIQAGAFAAAEEELAKLRKLEQEELLSKQPEEWRSPGLKALLLMGKFRANKSTVKPDELEEAFRVVLAPKKDEKKVHRDPEVYLAHYMYRLSGFPKVDDAKSAAAYLAALVAAKSDLEDALELAPTNISVLLTAAQAAQREAAAILASQGIIAVTSAVKGDSQVASQNASRAMAQDCFAKAREYYESAIKATPSDWRAYLGLGQLYRSSLGNNVDLAVKTYQRGLKEVKLEGEGIWLNLDLVEALIQQDKLNEADSVLKNLDAVLAKLNPKVRLSLQPLVNLRTAKLVFLKRDYQRYQGAIKDLADMVVSKDIVGKDKDTVPGGGTTPQAIYEAWMLLGQLHAALALDQSPAALEHRKQAFVAFEEASRLQPGELAPQLAAAEVSKAAGHRDEAINSYRQALAIVNAMKPAPEETRQGIYKELIALLEKQNLLQEAHRYEKLSKEQLAEAIARGQEQTAESVELTLRGIGQAIRDGKPAEALTIAERRVQKKPGDAWAYIALGLAQRANMADAKAVEAYRKAFETSKAAPTLQMQLAESLLKTGNLSDAAEAEKALRGLVATHAPACLRLVALLELRNKNDEALAIAESAIKSHPKDPLVHIALGTAWWGKKENSKAESAFREAVRLSPDTSAPALALLGFYAGTGQAKLARENLEQILQKAKLSEKEREILRADGLARLGDRKEAKVAYGKAVALAKDDPIVQMKWADFLLAGSDPAETAEGEKVLRSIMRQHDPARRRLAELLVARGGEIEAEEAQRLLEQSPGAAGDPASLFDRFAQARLMVGRGGTENLAKAAGICQKLLDDGKQPLPAARLLLAQIRERQNNLAEARKQYKLLVDQDHPAPIQLAVYVDFLLRNGPAAEADQGIKQLEKLAPEKLGTAEFRARWLCDQKRTAEIEPLVEGVAGKLQAQVKDNPGQEAQLARAVGDLYERIKQYASAERWYRRLVKLSPEQYGVLAMTVAKQGRIADAIALCNEAAKTDKSVRPALVVCSILVSGWATSQDMNSSEPDLKKALETFKSEPALLAGVANVRLLQNKASEAIELYRQILAQQPKNVEVLNNLATMLAEQPEPENRKEALKYIDQAIDLAGPQPGLMDTKGMALFYDGKPDQAVGVLKLATQTPNPDPRYYFHLAVAYGRLGQLDQGRAALQQARAGDLEHQVLTKMDRQLLAELEKKLGL
jgi:tetratricopeptide (TPR) repeat protein